MKFVSAFMNCVFDRQRDGIEGDTLVQSTRLLLMVHLAAGHIVRFLASPPYGAGEPWRAVAMGALCAMAIKTSWRRWALAIALPLQVLHVYQKFPAVANHLWVEALLLFVLVLVAESDEDNAVYRQFACWLTVIILFYTGLQKAWYGTYFDGRYLATKIALFPHYRDFFAIFMPREGIERLVSYAPIRVGSGPFRVDSLMYLAIVNSVWIVEVLAGVLLVFRRTRVLGWLLGLLAIIGIEVVAREVFFGVLFVAILLAFLRRDFVRRLLPWAVVFYAYLIAVHFFARSVDWIPEFTFYP